MPKSQNRPSLTVQSHHVFNSGCCRVGELLWFDAQALEIPVQPSDSRGGRSTSHAEAYQGLMGKRWPRGRISGISLTAVSAKTGLGHRRRNWGLQHCEPSPNCYASWLTCAITHADLCWWLGYIRTSCSFLRRQTRTLVHGAGFPAPGLRRKIMGHLTAEGWAGAHSPVPTAVVRFFSMLSFQRQTDLLWSFLGIEMQLHAGKVLFYLVQLLIKEKLWSGSLSAPHPLSAAMQAEDKEKSPVFINRKGQVQ